MKKRLNLKTKRPIYFFINTEKSKARQIKIANLFIMIIFLNLKIEKII